MVGSPLGAGDADGLDAGVACGRATFGDGAGRCDGPGAELPRGAGAPGGGGCGPVGLAAWLHATSAANIAASQTAARTLRIPAWFCRFEVENPLAQ